MGKVKWDLRILLDLVQRVYTDDGRGDGRLTAAGVRLLRSPAHQSGSERGVARHPVLEPLVVVTALNRRELSERLTALSERSRRSALLPLRLRERSDGEAARLATALFGKIYAAEWLSQSTDLILVSLDRGVMQQEASMAGLALEIYRREHGGYPETLDALTPSLLPRVPRDRADGEPIRYVVLEGRPIIYSVWQNLSDDGGDTTAIRVEVEPGSRWHRSVPMDLVLWRGRPVAPVE